MNVGFYHKIFSSFKPVINLNIYKIPRFLVIFTAAMISVLLSLFSAVKKQSLTALQTIFVSPFFPRNSSEGGSRYSLVTTLRWAEPLHVNSRTPVKLLFLGSESDNPSSSPGRARRCALEMCRKKKCELRFQAWLNLYIIPTSPQAMSTFFGLFLFLSFFFFFSINIPLQRIYSISSE